jgi:uncharacterized protein (DUF2236 family)
MKEGYFGPDTITWQLYREPYPIVGGVRALLLQIAHPAVAQGVAQYSNFQSDPFGRGFRTFQAMANIYFGDRQQAEKTAGRLQKIHSGIKGHYPGAQPASEVAFVATAPELLLWVLATLTDTTLKVFEGMPIPNLPADWRERFYEESKIAARLMGIPNTVYPADLQAFNVYFDAMLQGDLLGSTPACRAMAQAIVRHPKAPGKWLDRFAAGWMPDALCERLGISTRPDSAQRIAKIMRRARGLFLLIPRPLRYNPAYHQALARMARANGEPVPVAGRFFDWLSRKTSIPFGL